MAALRGGMSRFILGSARVKNWILIGDSNFNYYGLALPSQFVSSRGVASKLFIGGLSFFMTEDTLSEAFSQFGQVIEARIIMDKVSQRPKGFGFVTFASEDEARKAVAEMNGKVLNGRVIFVENAKVKPSFHDARPIARGPPESAENM